MRSAFSLIWLTIGENKDEKAPDFERNQVLLEENEGFELHGIIP